MAIAKEAQIDEVRDLVAKGKERGFLTNEEVIEALAPVDVSAEQMDNILQHLQDENIEVVEMVDELDAEEFAREARSARDEELALKAPTNDPVRMYLKEIGKVPLLTADQEVQIGRRIENGQIALRRALAGIPLAVNTNTTPFGTAFCVPIDAKRRISTAVPPRI